MPEYETISVNMKLKTTTKARRLAKLLAKEHDVEFFAIGRAVNQAVDEALKRRKKPLASRGKKKKRGR